eukprot:CAMPEP_0171915020 /NCGR_PEP_ID=MMETSP0993-20121228/13382_1 /TAXON_ID=483369 /ORGANISM="non described non described, Strain CCMP2098" /LENGTH=124 /DNA_ID=CAMNT_0012549795 /DNA_START=108 /DNA_END=479 /DNA_ORIENTATION=+
MTVGTVKANDGKWLKRSKLVTAIAAALKLKNPEKRKTKKKSVGLGEDESAPSEPVAVVLLLPLGRERALAGGDMRSRVVDLCKKHFAAEGGVDLSDDEALGKACDKSEEFAGLFKLLDVEIRLA